MAVRTPRIVWMRGPFPASVSDITTFRGGLAEQDEEDWDKSSLYFATKALRNGAKGLADDGYKGEPDALLTWKEGILCTKSATCIKY
jgi:hypothetical protein